MKNQTPQVQKRHPGHPRRNRSEHRPHAQVRRVGHPHQCARVASSANWADPCVKRNSLGRRNQRKSRLAKGFARRIKARCSPPCDLSAVLLRYLVLPAPGSRSLSLACHGSFHLDFHAHPRMDAALKKMFTFRQTRDLALAALKDSGFGHREVRKAASTFGNRVFSWGIKHR